MHFMQDNQHADEVLCLVHGWQERRLKSLWETVFCDSTYVVQSVYSAEPRGLDLLSQMPSQKYRDKLCYVWEWCKSLAASPVSSPLAELQLTAGAVKPKGLHVKWDL